MRLFGPSKIKTTPKDFEKAQLDKIFSADFIDAERNKFTTLSKEVIVLQGVNPDKYLGERQNVIYNLFQLAWDRSVPYTVFIEYSSIMLDDPRVKEIDSGVYDLCLSKAQQAGMDTFGFIAKIFIAQILLQGIDTNDADYLKLYKLYGTDFTSLYLSFKALIKRHKFVT